MGIKDELRADQAEQQRLTQLRRCGTCRALAELSDEARTEYEEEIMPDKSFSGASIARWLTAKTSVAVTEESVGKHRKNHLA